MERSEHETQILVNEQDWAEGFFIFSTTRQARYQKFVEMVGGIGNLIECKVHQGPKGGFDSATLKVPTRFWSNAAFKVKRPSSQREMERRKELGQALARAQRSFMSARGENSGISAAASDVNSDEND